MSVIPGKPHIFLAARQNPEGFPIVTPTAPYKGKTIIAEGKVLPATNTCWWHVAEHDKLYGENYLKPLDDPGDDAVDTFYQKIPKPQFDDVPY